MRTLLMTLGLLAMLAVPAAEAAKPRRNAFAHARRAAAPSRAEAQAILDDIARRGARPVLDDLYGREARWRPVIEGVASGEPKWLEVAARVKPVALRNLSVSQELTVAVSRALERGPAEVLAVLEGAFDTDSTQRTQRSAEDAENRKGTGFASSGSLFLCDLCAPLRSLR